MFYQDQLIGDYVQSSTVKNIMAIMLKLIIGGGLLWWTIYNGSLNFSMVRDIFSQPSIIGLLFFILLLISGNNFRWYLLLQGQGFQLSFWQTLKLTFIGLFFNFAIPGAVGGDLAKGYYLVKDQHNRKVEAGITVLMDRIIGLFGMIIIALFSIFFFYNSILEHIEFTYLAAFVIAAFCAYLICFSISFSKRIIQNVRLNIFLEKIPCGHFIRRVLVAIHTYRLCPKHFFLALLMGIVTEIGFVSLFIMIGELLHFTDIPLSLYFFVIPLGLIVIALPISPAGIGVGQAAFLFLFNLGLGYESDLGPTIITTVQVMMLFYGLLGAILYFYHKPSKVIHCRK